MARDLFVGTPPNPPYKANDGDSVRGLVLLQHDNAGFSAPVVFRYKAQGAGNGLSPCQALQRRSEAPQERPKGWSVSVAPLI